MSTADLYFHDLFENTGYLIQYVAPDGKILTVNPAWLNHLGYSLDEVQGKLVSDFIAPDEHVKFQQYCEASKARGSSDDFQITFLTSQGVPLMCEGKLRMIVDEKDGTHTRGVFRDVTFKKAQEKERNDQLLRATQFLENAPDAVVIFDENQIVSEWNLKAVETFGYTKNEIINKPLSDTIIPQIFRKTSAKSTLTGENQILNTAVETRAANKTGKEFPISLSISSVKVQDEWFYIAFMSDISDKKQKEQQLINHKSELEQTKREGEKSKDFLSIASHELKTPLTSIKAYLQLAIRNYDINTKEQNLSFIKKAEQSAEKLGKLIFTLLDISKIQAGKHIVQKQSADLDQLLQEIVSTSQFLYPSHIFKYEGPGSTTVDFDPARMEQVFANLLNNAVKYSPKAVNVDVKLSLNNDAVIISVRDYGKGIKIDNQTKVFDKFYRVEELTKTDTQGLGIGLYISSEIVKQHEGKIWVENNSDAEGATFFVSLPL